MGTEGIGLLRNIAMSYDFVRIFSYYTEISQRANGSLPVVSALQIEADKAGSFAVPPVS
jgi:hypothetical protein